MSIRVPVDRMKTTNMVPSAIIKGVLREWVPTSRI